MAILRPRAVTPRIPEIGRIYKGSPKGTSQGKGGYKGGDDLDHFRFEAASTTKDLPATDGSDRSLYEQLNERWAALGESPRSIPIRFMYRTPEMNFSYSNEVWGFSNGAERCTVRCNGEIMSRYPVDRTDPKTGKTYKTIVQGAARCQAPEDGDSCPMGCKPSGRLSFVIPALGYPGTVLMTTHSIYDIEEIKGNLEAYRQFDLSAIPFRLVRTLKPCNWNKPDGSIMPQKKWLCHVEIDSEFGMLALQGSEAQYRAELASGYPRQSRSLPPAPMELEAEVYQEEEEEAIAQFTTAVLDRLRQIDSHEKLETAIAWINEPEQRSKLESEGGWSVVQEAIVSVRDSIAPVATELIPAGENPF